MHQTDAWREIVSLLLKHKYKILFTFLMTVSTATIGMLLMPPVYESTATLLVKFGREYIYRPTVSDSRGPSNYFNRDGIINTEIEILTSRDLAAKFLTTLGVHKVYPDLASNPPSHMPPMEAALEKFQDDLSVQGIRESNVIHVSFQHTDPQTTAMVVNRFINAFQEKHLQTFSETGIYDFLAEKVSAYSRKIKELEARSRAFKQRYLAFSIADQQNILLTQRSEIETDLRTTQSYIAELEQKIDLLKNEIKKVDKSIPVAVEPEKNSIIDQAKSELLVLHIKKQITLKKYKKNHPEIVNLDKQITIVNEFLRNQKSSIKNVVRIGRNGIYDNIQHDIINLKSNLNSQKGKISILQEQVQQLDKKLHHLVALEEEFRNLERELSLNETKYLTYANKLEEARISNEMDHQKMTNIRTIQAAGVPTKPIRPQKRTMMVTALILGVAAGIGIAFVSEYTRQGFSTPESAVKHLGLPILATVSYKQ